MGRIPKEKQNHLSLTQAYPYSKLLAQSYIFSQTWFGFLKLGFLKKCSFQKVQYEKVFFQKTECLVKTVKKCFLKKLSVWLALIKMTV